MTMQEFSRMNDSLSNDFAVINFSPGFLGNDIILLYLKGNAKSSQFVFGIFFLINAIQSDCLIYCIISQMKEERKMTFIANNTEVVTIF